MAMATVTTTTHATKNAKTFSKTSVYVSQTTKTASPNIQQVEPPPLQGGDGGGRNASYPFAGRGILTFT
jgi:hypothetical protein